MGCFVGGRSVGAAGWDCEPCPFGVYVSVIGMRVDEGVIVAVLDGVELGEDVDVKEGVLEGVDVNVVVDDEVGVTVNVADGVRLLVGVTKSSPVLRIMKSGPFVILEIIMGRLNAPMPARRKIT